MNGSTAVNDPSAKKCEVQSELEEKKNPIPAHFCSNSTATAQLHDLRCHQEKFYEIIFVMFSDR